MDLSAEQTSYLVQVADDTSAAFQFPRMPVVHVKDRLLEQLLL
jgi:hypothetical protein